MPIRFNIEALKFDVAAWVLPQQDRLKASRFSLPIPAFDGEPLRYPDHYPPDMRNRDRTRHAQAGQPHPKASRPLEDWRGQPILGPDGSAARGVVFFNYEDALYQGVQSTGDRILLFNRPTPEQARRLAGYIDDLGGPAALTSVARVNSVLKFAQELGLDDRYDSTLAYAEKSLVPLTAEATGLRAYGLHLRRNELVRAIHVPGPAQFGDVLLDARGGVFLLIATDPKSGQRDIRQVSPDSFAATYTSATGAPIRVEDLPVETPPHEHQLAAVAAST